MKAKKYFDKEYGNDHIKAVVDLKDLESLYRLMQEYADEQLRIAAVIKSLPDSYEIRMKARELDEKDFDQWWWETVYKGNVL